MSKYDRYLEEIWSVAFQGSPFDIKGDCRGCHKLMTLCRTLANLVRNLEVGRQRHIAKRLLEHAMPTAETVGLRWRQEEYNNITIITLLRPGREEVSA